MNQLRLRNNQLSFKTSGIVLTALHESMENTLIESRNTKQCQHVNQLDLH